MFLSSMVVPQLISTMLSQPHLPT